MQLLGNLIWFVLGGFVMGLAWWVAAALTALTIVGIPFAIAAFRIGTLSFWPFGRQVIEGASPGEAGATLVLAANVVWILLGGFWLTLGHLFWALVFALTIVGIPFAIQHVKLAKLSWMPFGKIIIVTG